jgi:hypothetical protein
MKQVPDLKLPVIVSCPTRFVVVAPGETFPLEILSSSEGKNSDLVGFYSLRQAGLDGVLDSNMKHDMINSSLFIELIVGANVKSFKKLNSVDLWTDRFEERSTMISFIYETEQESIRKNEVFEYEKQIQDQLMQVWKAYKEENLAGLTYYGQMFSAFLSAINNKQKLRSSKFKARRQFYIYLVIAYSMIAITLIALIPLKNSNFFSTFN